MSDIGRQNSLITQDSASTQSICPSCHIRVRPTDSFCFNCGKNLQPQPLPTSISSQIILYLKCVLLPPLGIIWGIQYLRKPGRLTKIVGLVAIILTFVITIIVVEASISLINILNNNITDQLQNIQNF